VNPKPTLDGIADAILDGAPVPLIAQMLSALSGFAAIEERSGFRIAAARLHWESRR
jgi:hypothetical protein